MALWPWRKRTVSASRKPGVRNGWERVGKKTRPSIRFEGLMRLETPDFAHDPAPVRHAPGPVRAILRLES
jgi:hypothetical protein